MNFTLFIYTIMELLVISLDYSYAECIYMILDYSFAECIDDSRLFFCWVYMILSLV